MTFRPTTGRPKAIALFPERRPDGGEVDGTAVDAAGRTGHDQAAGRVGGAPALDVLPLVPGDGAHGIPVERGDVWSTPSRSPVTRRPRRRSSTTGRQTR